MKYRGSKIEDSINHHNGRYLLSSILDLSLKQVADQLIYVGVPDTAGRRRILAIHTEDMPLASDVDLESLAQRAERFTGADLEDLVRRAGLTALRRGLDADKVTMADFEAALAETRASVTADMLEEYERIEETLKSEAVRPTGIGFVLPGMLRSRGGDEKGPAH